MPLAFRQSFDVIFIFDDEFPFLVKVQDTLYLFRQSVRLKFLAVHHIEIVVQVCLRRLQLWNLLIYMQLFLAAEAAVGGSCKRPFQVIVGGLVLHLNEVALALRVRTFDDFKLLVGGEEGFPESDGRGSYLLFH